MISTIKKNDEWLSEVESFEPTIGIEKIMRIKDRDLREIRIGFNEKRRLAFENEQGIPDSKLGDVFDQIEKEENIALIKYKEEIKLGNDV